VLVSNKLYAKNYFKRWLKMDRICSLYKSLKLIYSFSLEKKFQYFIQSVLFYNLPLKYMIGLLLRLFFFWMIKQILVRHYGRFLLWDPTKKGQWVLHVYTIATYVVSWLKWLQMNLNDLSWFFRHKDTHLESFRSWGNKINCIINMQFLSFFCVGSQTQCED
jgi:hypothetical protein